jgi:membrane dipeptidase
MPSLPRLTALLLSASALSSPVSAAPADPQAVHQRAIVIDAHADVANPLDHPDATGTIDEGSQIDLAKLRAGGVDAIFLSVHAPQQPRTPEGLATSKAVADAKLAAIHAIAERHPDQAEFARTAADIRRITAEGKIAIAASILNASPLGQDPDALADYARRGVSMIGFTHAGNNDFADSSRPFARDTPGENGGLTALGRATVAEANRLGILLDVSQLSTPALLQTTQLTKAPVIASHSGLRAKVDNVRNLSDAELDAIKRTGGAVCIVSYSAYLRNFTDAEQAPTQAVLARYGGLKNGYEGLTPEQKEAFYKELEQAAPRASLDDYVDSIDYAVKRIGIDHVCLSTDFNHGFAAIEGWTDEGETPNVTAALLRRGYDERKIDRLWSGNLLRVLARAEALGAALAH